MDKEDFWGIYSKQRVLMTADLAKLLSDILNRIHDSTFSERFWKIILRPYLSAIISDKQRLSTKIIRENVPLEVYVNTVFPKRKDIIYGRTRYIIKSYKNWSKFGTKDDWNHFENVGLGFHDHESITNNIDYFCNNKYPCHLPRLLNSKKRKVDIQHFTDSNFNEIFLENVIYHLPKVYVENFWSFFNRIELNEPQNKIFHVSFFENFYMSLIVAKYVENGAKLYYYQHGAFYGEYPYHSAHRFESDIADRFLTWGWKLLQNDYPDQAYRLMKIKRNFISNSRDKSIDKLIVFPDFNGRNNNQIIDRGKYLFDNMKRNKFDRIVARPRPSAKIQRSAELDFIPDNVVLDSGYSNMLELVNSSRLVIQITLPATNFFECLAVDQPTVGILDNNNPSKIIEPHYKFLLSVGVIHRNVESLVKHINIVDLENWWEGVLKEEGYRMFKKEFLNTND